MLQRNLNSDFVGGAYVFPGGGVDATDQAVDLSERFYGLDAMTMNQQLRLTSGGPGYFVAALREMFEEAGLLLARHADGTPLHFAEAALRERFTMHRNGLNERTTTFADVVTSEDLQLDFSAVVYVAHWVTPEGGYSRRYDTRFFVAPAPADQLASHDDGETVANRWVRPSDALAAHERGELDMIFPTIRTLESVAHLTSVAELLTWARSREDIPTIQPRIKARGDSFVVLAPGDPGFDD
jgi:8-oxo-dGTP pyrophosphatase MutT (NUDIX family)